MVQLVVKQKGGWIIYTLLSKNLKKVIISTIPEV